VGALILGCISNPLTLSFHDIRPGVDVKDRREDGYRLGTLADAIFNNRQELTPEKAIGLIQL